MAKKRLVVKLVHVRVNILKVQSISFKYRLIFNCIRVLAKLISHKVSERDVADGILGPKTGKHAPEGREK